MIVKPKSHAPHNFRVQMNRTVYVLQTNESAIPSGPRPEGFSGFWIKGTCRLYFVVTTSLSREFYQTNQHIIFQSGNDSLLLHPFCIYNQDGLKQ